MKRGVGEKGVPNARNTIHRKKSPSTRIVSFPRIAEVKSNLRNSLNHDSFFFWDLVWIFVDIAVLCR